MCVNVSVCVCVCVCDIVRRTSYRFGLRESSEGEDFNLYWTDTSVTLDRLVGIKPYQVTDGRSMSSRGKCPPDPGYDKGP